MIQLSFLKALVNEWSREKKKPILSMLCELAQREIDIPSEKITHEKAHYLTFSRIADFWLANNSRLLLLSLN